MITKNVKESLKSESPIKLVCLTVAVKGYVEIKERFMKEVLANISEHDRSELSNQPFGI